MVLALLPGGKQTRSCIRRGWRGRRGPCWLVSAVISAKLLFPHPRKGPRCMASHPTTASTNERHHLIQQPQERTFSSHRYRLPGPLRALGQLRAQPPAHHSGGRGAADTCGG